MRAVVHIPPDALILPAWLEGPCSGSVNKCTQSSVVIKFYCVCRQLCIRLVLVAIDTSMGNNKYTQSIVSYHSMQHSTAQLRVEDVWLNMYIVSVCSQTRCQVCPLLARI